MSDHLTEIAKFRSDLLAVEYDLGGLKTTLAQLRKDYNAALLDRIAQQGKLPALLEAANASFVASGKVVDQLRHDIREACSNQKAAPV